MTVIELAFLLNLAWAVQINPPPHDPPYPTHWWAEIVDPAKPIWEILPQEAKYGEVILSKRNELGVLSNFAATPFLFDGQLYASMEGFWQATKYPEDEFDPRLNDPRVHWKYTRKQVEQMTAFEAKEAGQLASQNMKLLGINWVSYKNKKMIYKEKGESPFYHLIKKAMEEKLLQNPKVYEVLMQTGELVLKPDHHSEEPELKAWQYFDIWMELRKKYTGLTLH